MWKRNLLMLFLGAAGLAALAANLLSEQRLRTPQHVPFRLVNDQTAATVDRLNSEFQQLWQQHALQPAERADELVLARRLSLGLTGTVPSLEEIRALEAQPPERRLAWWISHLLEDRRYADYVGERFARAFVGTEDGPFIIYRRRRFVSWLSDRLATNDRYDAIVRDLISDTGIWTDSPAVNFLTVTVDDSEDEQPSEVHLAARTTRAFLGMRIDCLQCHDDHLGNLELGPAHATRYGEQQDFHRLAAFFSDAQVSLTGIRDKSAPYEYQYLNAEQTEVVEPAVPFLPELLDPKAGRRHQLARWLTHPENKPFARATVNRLWALMFGKPLVEPVDNIPLYGPFPPGLETLADDFIAHRYDLRRLIRVIAATDVFQRDSRADFEITSEHEANWAVFPLTRLRPEQVAGGLIQSCSLTTIDADAHIFAKLGRFFQQNDFIERYGDAGDDEFMPRSGTITQRLLLMNGSLIKERTNENLISNASTQVAQLAPDDRTAVEVAYLSILSRRPTEAEAAHFESRLREHRGQRRNQHLEDLFWVLLNSTEFSWNH